MVLKICDVLKYGNNFIRYFASNSFCLDMPRNKTKDKIRAKSSDIAPPKREYGKNLINGFGRLNLGTLNGTTKCETLDDIVEYIKSGKAKEIVALVGAGISTASGIPDFRTPGTGLYDNLKKYHIPYPEAIFEIDYFRNMPKPFYTLAKDLYPGNYKPNTCHYFLRMIHEKGFLRRIYTQNIDGLERLCGIPATKLVEAHGSFYTCSCIRCGANQSPEDVKNKIMSDSIPRCGEKRCNGLVKPDIVFFGEDLPQRFYNYLSDMNAADLVLVIGTSLQVHPFASIVNHSKIYIPRCLFNRAKVGPFVRKTRLNDVVVKGDLPDIILDLAEKLQWREELREMEGIWKLELEENIKKNKNVLKIPKPPSSSSNNVNNNRRNIHTFTKIQPPRSASFPNFNKPKNKPSLQFQSSTESSSSDTEYTDESDDHSEKTKKKKNMFGLTSKFQQLGINKNKKNLPNIFHNKK